jgi:dynein heavy chain
MKEAGVKGEDPSMLEMWIYFINRVKDCLHTVLCFSPVGNKFRTRAQKFPSLFSQCNIDWFLPWPEEALISVSEKFLSDFKIDNTKQVKSELIIHMGKVHNMVTEVCGNYFAQMRRHVYVTPKSYLSFIAMYKELYDQKYKLIDIEEQNINNGLEKLAEATEGVEELKIDLRKEDAKLKIASEETDVLLKELDVENKKADVKSKEVAAVTDACMEQKANIGLERATAEKDLEAAMPFLRRAEKAVESIRPQDIGELKVMKKPADATRLVMDTVNILFLDPLVPVACRDYNILKQVCPFIEDSYEAYAGKQLQGNFLG